MQQVSLPFPSLGELEFALSVLTFIVTTLAVFVLAIWYFSLDRKTNAYDDDLREAIKDNRAFSGIRRSADVDIYATSDSALSKGVTKIKELLGRRSNRPDKIVVLDGDVFQKRKEEIIRERVREIPGKNILREDLVAALRNYYGFKLALASEDISSEVVEHFQNNFEKYEHSSKIKKLGKTDSYESITLLDDPVEEYDPLNDVFLRLVEAAELHCIGPVDDVNGKHEEIERCREFLMLALIGLWAERMKGVQVAEEQDRDTCLQKYRVDIRDEDNWSYWVLPCEECDESEFKRIRHLGWRIDEIASEHWGEGVYDTFHTHGDSIRDMQYVPTPFVIVQKDEKEFRGGFSSAG